MDLLYQYCDVKKELTSISRQIKALEKQKDNEHCQELLDRYEYLYDELMIRQLKIEEIVQKLEPIERTLIRYRYFEQLPWQVIFRKLNYSQKQTFRIHSKIIQKLNNLSR